MQDLTASLDAANLSHQEQEKLFQCRIEELSDELNELKRNNVEQGTAQSEYRHEISILREENEKYKNERLSGTSDKFVSTDDSEEKILR